MKMTPGQMKDMIPCLVIASMQSALSAMGLPSFLSQACFYMVPHLHPATWLIALLSLTT